MRVASPRPNQDRFDLRKATLVQLERQPHTFAAFHVRWPLRDGCLLRSGRRYRFHGESRTSRMRAMEEIKLERRCRFVDEAL